MSSNPTSNPTLIRRPTVAAFALVLVTAVLGVAACSGSSSSSSQARSNGIIVKDAWARASAMSSGTGAAYVTIENTSGQIDKLLSVSVPSSVAGSAQIHETVSSSSDGTGMMSMREVASVTIPAGATVTFEPGGYHIMLMDLAAPLENGKKFMLNLGFVNAGVMQIEVTVKNS